MTRKQLFGLVLFVLLLASWGSYRATSLVAGAKASHEEHLKCSSTCKTLPAGVTLCTDQCYEAP